MSDTCEAWVYEGDDWHRHQCGNTAKEEFNGMALCGTHLKSEKAKAKSEKPDSKDK